MKLQKDVPFLPEVFVPNNLTKNNLHIHSKILYICNKIKHINFLTYFKSSSHSALKRLTYDECLKFDFQTFHLESEF